MSLLVNEKNENKFPKLTSSIYKNDSFSNKNNNIKSKKYVHLDKLQ